MIGSVSASRRANAFAQLLEESRLEQVRPGGEAAEPSPPAPPAPSAAEPGEASPQPTLLSVARRLTALPRPGLSTGTKREQRAQLIAALESAPAPRGERLPGQRPQRQGQSRTSRATAPGGALGRLRPRSRLSKGLAAGGLTMGVAAGALGGVAAASSDALPGDTLYGLKRGMEDLRLDLTSSDADRGRVYLDHAATRLNEARRLMERGRSGPLGEGDLADIRSALLSMRDDAAAGHRLLRQAYEADGSMDPIESLSSFSEDYLEAWTRLRDKLPPELRDVSDEVSEVFDAIEEEVAPLRGALSQEPEAASTASPQGGPSRRPVSDGGTTRAPDSASARQEPDQPRQTATRTAGSQAAQEPEEEGLLGATGLLGRTSSGTGSSGAGTGTHPGTSPGDGAGAGQQPAPGTGEAEPEVTIPPLVEDLLPRLGLDVGNTKRTD